MNTIYLASDHAGFSTKEKLISFLRSEFKIGDLYDLGPQTEERVDYPDFADQVCRELKRNDLAQGILICGSGQGMAMRANKYPHIRAALCWNTESARLAREHNDANLLCLGSRLISEEDIFSITRIFFTTPFAGGRHEGRVKKINSSL